MSKLAKPLWPEDFAQRAESVASNSDLVNRLAEGLRMPLSNAQTLYDAYLPLAAYLAPLTGPDCAPFMLGVNGAQGTGKSTAASVLRTLLEELFVRRVCAISIDDLYLSRAARAALGNRIHPLLTTRGVPGTHDLNLALRVFEQLQQAGSTSAVAIPRFNKAIDDCVPQAQWDCFEGKPDVVIFEGWCVGARPQRIDDLLSPVNSLEREEDSDGAWRRYVNDCLRNYQQLFDQMDSLVMLKAPSFDQVLEWRQLQEDKLRSSLSSEQLLTSKVMSPDEIVRFIAHYERLTRWMLQEMPARAQVLLALGEDHQIATIKCHIER